MVEEAPSRGPVLAARPLLRLVDVEAEEADRIPTGVAELDRVLGGGLVPASLVLVGGEPGVGKSTLLLSALRAMSSKRRVLLVTGEESPAQVGLRAARLGGAEVVETWPRQSSTRHRSMLEARAAGVCVIDSVQTLYRPDRLGAGLGGAVREAAARYPPCRAGRRRGVPGRPRKGRLGRVDRVLEHLVDCVLQFEATATTPTACCGDQNCWLDERAGRVRDDWAGSSACLDPSAIFGRD
jgi:DNA repair protein RadA/Sms